MATTSIAKLEKVLTSRLGLAEPEFHLEKLSGGKLSGSVVSDSFEMMDHSERQRKIWDALEEEFGADSRNLVGTLLAYTKAEWNVPLQGDPVNIKRKRKTS